MAALSEGVIQERIRKVEQLQSIFMVCQTKRNEILKTLGWTKESCKELAVERSKCHVDASHVVPSVALDKHEYSCAIRHCGGSEADIKHSKYSPAFFYAGMQRVVPVSMSAEQVSAVCTRAEASNSNSGVQGTRVPHAAPQAAGSTGDGQFSSLQDSEAWLSPAPALSPMETLKMVFGWQLIPRQFWHITMQTVDLSAVQTWIKSNLPSSVLMSTVVDADGQLLDVITNLLQSSCTPDGLLDQMKPLLGRASRDFVLHLWKILVSLGMAPSLGLEKHHVFLADAATQKQPILESQGSSELNAKLRPLMHIPWTLVPAVLSPAQRWALYEHGAENARDVMRQAEFTAEDLLTAIEKHPGSKMYDEEDRQKAQDLVDVLARDRDYKRRRQSYRAKNVHITKRSAVEIMRDLISVGMKEFISEGIATEQSTETRVPSSSAVHRHGDRRDSRERSTHRRDHERRHDSSSRPWQPSPRLPEARSTGSSSGQSRHREKSRPSTAHLPPPPPEAAQAHPSDDSSALSAHTYHDTSDDVKDDGIVYRHGDDAHRHGIGKRRRDDYEHHEHGSSKRRRRHANDKPHVEAEASTCSDHGDDADSRLQHKTVKCEYDDDGDSQQRHVSKTTDSTTSPVTHRTKRKKKRKRSRRSSNSADDANMVADRHDDTGMADVGQNAIQQQHHQQQQQQHSGNCVSTSPGDQEEGEVAED